MTRVDAYARSRRSLLAAIAAWLASTHRGTLSRSAAREAPSAKTVLDVQAFEALARTALRPAHYAYIGTGADGDRTAVWNHEAYEHLQIRSRRFADVREIDTSRQVFDRIWKQPIYFSAISSMRAFHEDGELGVARAAAARGVQMMLSTTASCSIEDVAADYRAPLWHQLYATDNWDVTTALVKRAEKAGCEAIALTIDTFRDRNNETLIRGMAADPKRDCERCHGPTFNLLVPPMYDGLALTKITEDTPTNLSVDYLKKLRRLVNVKLLLKGIVTAEDARLALRAGVDGLIVSNHGGRSEETLRSTIECLPEIVGAVGKRVPVFIDGGIRRGTDVFKALALGAAAVGIGRPLAWGLAAYGQSGVEAVSDILLRELRTIMRVAGAPQLAAISHDRVVWGRY